MAQDEENFGGESHSDRRVCAQHSGMDAKLNIFNWLLGLLIASILGSAGVLYGGLSNINDTMFDVKLRLAGVMASKEASDLVHQRLSERLTVLEHRVDGNGRQ